MDKNTEYPPAAEDIYELILRAFKCFNGFDGPSCDSLWWRTDGEYAPVTLLVNCNDLFYWACSDCETLTEENIADLERATEDCRQVQQQIKEATPPDAKIMRDVTHYADMLFCCRVRGMRPQGAYYKYIPKELHELFNQCGPEREVGFGNPLSNIVEDHPKGETYVADEAEGLDPSTEDNGNSET